MTAKKKQPPKPQLTNKKGFFETHKYSKYFLFLLILITAFLYSPILKHDFVNFDDDALTYRNPKVIEIAKEGNLKAFEKSMWLYDPLTLLTHGIIYRHYGENPLPYHLINLLIHLINIILVFFLLKALFKSEWLAIIAASIFALHPMHVESVAWAAERKDVLYSLFYLFGLICYMYAQQKEKYYYLLILAWFCMIFSLLSKFSAVTFPFVLILIDYFTKRKFCLKTIFEKITFLLPVLIFAIYAFSSDVIIKNNEVVLNDYSFFDRLTFFTYALSFYAYKLIIPFNLYAFIPYPAKINGYLPAEFYYSVVPFILLIVVSIVMLVKWKSIRYELIFGMLFFGLNIALVLHIIPFGGNVIVADRYTYLPGIGISILLFYTVRYIINNFQTLSLKQKNRFYVAIALIYIVFLFTYSFQRIPVWKNSITLFTDVINKDQTAALAYYNRGLALSYENKTEEAINDYNKAIELKPVNVDIYNNRGLAKSKLNDFTGAIEDYNKAITYNSNYINAYINRSVAKYTLKDYQGSIEDCNKVILLDSNVSAAYNNRGLAYEAIKQYDNAKKDYEKAILLNPNNADGYFNLGNALYMMNMMSDALNAYNKCIQINQSHDKAICNRGFCYLNLNKHDEACKDWKQSSLQGNTTASYMFNKHCK